MANMPDRDMVGKAPTSWGQGRQRRAKARSREVRGPRETWRPRVGPQRAGSLSLQPGLSLPRGLPNPQGLRTF